MWVEHIVTSRVVEKDIGLKKTTEETWDDRNSSPDLPHNYCLLVFKGSEWPRKGFMWGFLWFLSSNNSKPPEKRDTCYMFKAAQAMEANELK